MEDLQKKVNSEFPEIVNIKIKETGNKNFEVSISIDVENYNEEELRSLREKVNKQITENKISLYDSYKSGNNILDIIKLRASRELIQEINNELTV